MMNTSVRKTQERYAKNTSKPNKQSNQNVSAGAYAAKCEVLSPHFFLIHFKWEERFKFRLQNQINELHETQEE